MIRDAALPAIAQLMGPEAQELLAAALAPSGEQVVAFRQSQIAYRPGRSLLVRYATTVRKPDGRQVVETLVAVTDTQGLPDGVLALEAAGLRVGVWRFPFDPELPGLLPATSGARVRQLLDRLGGPAGAVRLRTRAYRPTRRAVVEATIDQSGAAQSVLYLKVLPRHRAVRVHETHRALRDALPVPRSVGLAEEQGIVALTALPGVTLREALESGTAVPEPETLVELQIRLGRVPLTTTAKPAAMIDPRRHVELLSAVLPAERQRIEVLGARCAPVARSLPVTTVHGDFYEAQVLVQDGELVGLLDLDGAGPGHLEDDCATMIGHLQTLALIRPEASGRISSYSEGLFDVAAGIVGAEVLAPLVAAVCLGLATGPFRILEADWEAETLRRLALAESWLGRPHI